MEIAQVEQPPPPLYSPSRGWVRGERDKLFSHSHISSCCHLNSFYKPSKGKQREFGGWGWWRGRASGESSHRPPLPPVNVHVNPAVWRLNYTSSCGVVGKRNTTPVPEKCRRVNLNSFPDPTLTPLRSQCHR